MSSSCYSSRSGISLYTLLAAIVVLAVITTAVVTNYNGSDSTGRALYSKMAVISTAALSFRKDTGCYPTDIRVLVDFHSAASMNSCGTSLSKGVWNGPYIELGSTDGSGLKVQGFGANTHINVGSSNSGGLHYYIYATDLPSDIAYAAFDACGGHNSNCNISVDDTEFYFTYKRSRG